jgi:hypothetical protein
MDYPPVVMATIQSAALGGIANILAQGISAYRAGVNLVFTYALRCSNAGIDYLHLRTIL